MGRNLVKNGYLRVKISSKFKGFRVKAWKKRWVVVWHEEAPTCQLSLCIYKTESSAERDTSPSLKMPTSVAIDISWIKSKSQQFAFRIAQNDEHVCLAAESQKDADDWLNAIQSFVKVPSKYEAMCLIQKGEGGGEGTHKLTIDGKECLIRRSPDGTAMHTFHGADISSVRFTNRSKTQVDITLIIERHGEPQRELKVQSSADSDLYEQLRKLQVACLPDAPEGDSCNTWPKKRASKRDSFYDNAESSSTFEINENSIIQETQNNFQNLNLSQSMSGYGAIMPGSQLCVGNSGSFSYMNNQNASMPLLDDIGSSYNERINELWKPERSTSHGNIQRFDQMYLPNYRKMSEQLLSEHSGQISHIHSVPSLQHYGIGANVRNSAKTDRLSVNSDEMHNGHLLEDASVRHKQSHLHHKRNKKKQAKNLAANDQPPFQSDRPSSLVIPRKTLNGGGVKRSATFRNFFLRRNANRKQSLDSGITLAESTASDEVTKPKRLRSKSFRSYLKPKLVKSSFLSLVDGRENQHKEGKYVQRSRSMGNIKSSNQRRLSPRDLVMSSDHDLSDRRTSVPIPSNPTRHNSTQLLLETLLDLQHFQPQPRAPSVTSSRNSSTGAAAPADPVTTPARYSREESEDKTESQEKRDGVKVSTDHTGMYYDHLLQYLDQVTEELDQAEITDLEEDDRDTPRPNHFVPYSQLGSKGRLNLKLSASKLAAHEAVYMSMEAVPDLKQPFNKPKKKKVPTATLR